MSYSTATNLQITVVWSWEMEITLFAGLKAESISSFAKVSSRWKTKDMTHQTFLLTHIIPLRLYQTIHAKKSFRFWIVRFVVDWKQSGIKERGREKYIRTTTHRTIKECCEVRLLNYLSLSPHKGAFVFWMGEWAGGIQGRIINFLAAQKGRASIHLTQQRGGSL